MIRVENTAYRAVVECDRPGCGARFLGSEYPTTSGARAFINATASMEHEAISDAEAFGWAYMGGRLLCPSHADQQWDA